MAAVERMSVEGVACLVGALPPILRLAELPPLQLEDALDSWLHSGRTLLLQVRGAGGHGWWEGGGAGGAAAGESGAMPSERRGCAATCQRCVGSVACLPACVPLLL